MASETEFWGEAQAVEERRLARMRALFEGRHEVTLHSRDGGWKMPLYVTLNWLGDRLTQTLSALVFRGFPQISAAGAEEQREVARLISVLRLPALCLPTSLLVSYAGSAAWKAYLSPVTGAPALRLWGARAGELAWWEYVPGGAEPVAVSFYHDELLPGPDAVAVKVRERYALLPGGVEVSHSARRLEDGSPTDSPVPLAAIWPGRANLPPDEDFLPGWTPCLATPSPTWT